MDQENNGLSEPLDMWQLCHRLYPIARSLTGPGVRQTLEVLQQTIFGAATSHDSEHRLKVHAIATGTAAFDWTVPKEWSVSQAWIRCPDGRRIASFAEHNLHLVGYSQPLKTSLSLANLRGHLHSLPEQPQWIPYRTSYYAPTWGFCLSDAQLKGLQPGQYEVCIDSKLVDGEMNLGEVFIPGKTDDEILISTHLCHPSLANDNLSGIAVAAAMIRALTGQRQRLGVRFIFVPATIGAITWLAGNVDRLKHIKHALVLSNLGDSGPFHYKTSPSACAGIDRAFEHIRANAKCGQLPESFSTINTLPFSPYGYDERQFNSPGIALQAGSLMRTPFGQYPQYHTSADNLSFISQASLQESLQLCLQVIRVLQTNVTYRSLNPMCEPQLGKRGLYDNVGGNNQHAQRQLAMLWVMNQATGSQSLLDIAQRAGLDAELLDAVAQELQSAGLLEVANETR